MTKSKYRSFRCKTRCGLSVRWTVGPCNGKWAIIEIGNAKHGRNKVPTVLIPMIDFALSSAVVENHLFDTEDDAETHARSL
jgi:hypothetical protein